MSSLYRKYRPLKFSEVFGQDHIVKTLTNQISAGSISHAYIFCGTRGTGKTSIARLVARALNCSSNQQSNSLDIPCNVCHNCIAILQNRSMGVIEIDAASNNGVDNIREILEEVKYPPVNEKYKIYIIDEVHMLSIGAFNALLKTLEEPPEHVVFILATTEHYKVPATIHSRCQRFEFKRISSKEIAYNIALLLKNEGVSIDDGALNLVAKLGDGSVRDALSLLGQVISFYKDKTITEEMVRDLIGAVDNSTLFFMTSSLINKDVSSLLHIIQKVNILGRDFVQLTQDLITHFRNLMIAKIVKEPNSILDVSEEEFYSLFNQANELSIHEINTFIVEFSDLHVKIKQEKNQKILLEITCMKLCDEQYSKDFQLLESTVNENKKPQEVQKIKMPQEVREVDEVKTLQNDNQTINDRQLFDINNFKGANTPLIKGILETCEFNYENNTLYIIAPSHTESLLKAREDELKKVALSLNYRVNVVVSQMLHNQNSDNERHLGLSKDQVDEIKQKINMQINFD